MTNYSWIRDVLRPIYILILVLVLESYALGNKTNVQLKAPQFSKQQALFNRINLLEVWKTTRGDPNILIGVIDNGFDYFHPDLIGCLIPGFYASGGYHTEFYENVAHGTLVASIIVANDNNKTGMVGLAPRCHVLTASHGIIEHAILKLQKEFLKDCPKASLEQIGKEMLKHQNVLKTFATDWAHHMISSIADAIGYLVDHEVKVINISGALKQSLCPSPKIWKKLEDAFVYAAKKDVVIVIGAGNNSAMWEDYLGDPNLTIIVGATLLDDTRWEQELDYKGTKIKQGSNFGKRLTVMAPTENIQICLPHDKRFYAIENGPMGATKLEFKSMYDVLTNGATSSATPIVTLLVALVYSVRPDLDAKSMVDIVKQGCDDIGEKGCDIYTGYGRVNFGKTIKIAVAWGK
jgi:subtilisin family serine protease